MARGAGSAGGPRGRGRGSSRGGRGAGGRRGRGGRGRLPASVNNVLLELGNGDVSSYYASISEQPVANSTASRAFFPPLPDGDAKPAERLKDAEEIYCNILNVGDDTDNLHSFIQDAIKVRGLKQSSSNTALSIWDENNPVLVPELLPDEVRQDRASNKRRKSLRESNFVFPILTHDRETREDEGDENREDEDTEKDKEQVDPKSLQKLREEEEDAELADADYRITAKFDDDDGYVSEDSGNDAPLF